MYYRGCQDQAVDCYRRSLRLAKEASPTNDVEAAANLVALGTIAHTRQQHEESIELCREGLAHANSCGDIRHAVAARRILADSLRSQNLLNDASTELATAKMLCALEQLHFDEAAIIVSQAWLAYERAIVMSEPEIAAVAAEPLFRAGLKKAQKARNVVSQAEAAIGLVWCDFLRLDSNSASEHLAIAVSVSNTEKFEWLAAALSVGRAAFALLNGELAIAQNLYDEARQACANVGLPAWEADACVGLTAVHHRQGNTERGDKLEKEALELARSCGTFRTELVQMSLTRVKTNPATVPY